MYRNNGLIYKIYTTLFIFGLMYGSEDSVQVALNGDETSGGVSIYLIILFLIIIGYLFNSTLKQAGKENTFNFFNSIHKMVINYLIQNNYNQNIDFKNLTDEITTKQLFENINSVKAVELVLIKKDANQVIADIFIGIIDKDEQLDVKISKSYSWDQIPEDYRSKFINTGKTEMRFSLYVG